MKSALIMFNLLGLKECYYSCNFRLIIIKFNPFLRVCSSELKRFDIFWNFKILKSFIIQFLLHFYASLLLRNKIEYMTLFQATMTWCLCWVSFLHSSVMSLTCQYIFRSLILSILCVLWIAIDFHKNFAHMKNNL